MFTKKEFFTFIVLTALISGVVFGFSAFKLSQPIAGNTFQDGLDAAYNRLIKRGHASIVARGYGYRQSKQIGGKIAEIGDNAIALKVNPVNPLADPALDMRIVKIGNNTKIYKRVEKTSEQYSAEMEEFSKKMDEIKDNPEAELPNPPDIYAKEEISLADLAVDDQISITAEKNIHNVLEITPSEIVLEY